MDELTKARGSAFSIQNAPEDASFTYIGDVGGRKCLAIQMDSGVTLNGVRVR